MAEFTDKLGNPISEGDIIVYPLQDRATTATMAMARVTAIEPVTPVTDVLGYWPKDMELPENKRIPKKMVTMRSGGKMVYDPSKAYVVRGQKLSNGFRMYLQNVHHCVVVTNLIGKDLWQDLMNQSL